MSGSLLTKRLKQIVGAENVSIEHVDLLCYSRDASEHVGMPDVVVWPSETPQVGEIMKLANELRVPLTPRGAGTCLSGGPVPARKGILLVLTRMRNILEIDIANLQVLVECGVVWQDLNNELAPYKLFLPPDPSSGETCTIGGCVAECSGGVRAVKYGTFRDWTLGLQVVLPNGEVIETGAKTRKCVSGYDLTRLFLGSEGTLGVITRARLRIFPLPQHRLVMSAYFDSMESAGKAIFRVMTSDLIPSAAELMDRRTVEAVSKYMNMRFPECAGLAIFEFDGSSLGELKRRMRQARKLCKREKATRIDISETKEESERLWRARKSAGPALATLKPSSLHEDATVPTSRIPEMLTRIEQIAQKHNLLIPTFGHVGDGNLHPIILYDERIPDEVKRAEEAAADIFRAAIKLGGTLSGEHGIGLSKAPYFSMEHTNPEIEVMRKIKTALDPNNILNPGKIWAGT
ncbi:MAG: FAD-binding protein [Candidatus Korarchaeota archaeon]|nr:FAD-binding protein [Candidatus Korarchaeota archaeon]